MTDRDKKQAEEKAEQILLKNIGKAFNNKTVFHQRYLNAMYEYSDYQNADLSEQLEACVITHSKTMWQLQSLRKAVLNFANSDFGESSTKTAREIWSSLCEKANIEFNGKEWQLSNKPEEK